MFKNDSQSIQFLLAAEKKAEEKVNQARKRKHLRIKQAKEEAQAEIEKLRQEKNTEFKEYEAKYLGSKENDELKIERETEKTLGELSKYVKLNKELIIDYLLQQALTINCEVHVNFRAEVA
ncbi:v-type proton ATPase subunit G [Trichonephila clavipes]|nr:v-type proton ATPase subunit G [Trichonephila clavipes]